MLNDELRYKVCVSLNRYIVPFEFKDNFDFDAVCQQIDNKIYVDRSCWIRSKVNIENSEDEEDGDLFEYLVEEFSITEKESQNNKLGCHWRYHRQSGNNKIILSISYHEPGSDTELRVDITDMGLYVFRTGIGIMWYEAEIYSVDGQPINNHQLENFQHIFKELNDDIHIRNWLGNCLTWHHSSKEIDTLLSLTAKVYGDTAPAMLGNEERLPFSMGNWIAKKLEFLNIVYFSQRKNHYAEDLLVHYAKSRKGCVISQPTKQGGDNTNDRKKIIDKWKSETKQILEESNFKSKFPPVCPDKSLYFSYTFLGDNEKTMTVDERARTAYYLTNGYDRKVNVAEDIINSMKAPFSDVLWYATREGCGYYAVSNESKPFFRNVAAGKIKANYFILYIRVLYQSYTLLHFTHLLASDKVSVDYKKYISTEDDPYIDKKLQVHLSSLRSMINLFLLKSTVTSVSHIQHHNEFYSYLEKQLFLEEDIASVSIGLDVLDDFVKEQLKKEEERQDNQKHHKLEIILAMVTFLTLASTISDSHTFVQEAVGGNVVVLEWIIYLMIIIVLVIKVVCYYEKGEK